MRRNDLTGRQFGKLTVQGLAGQDIHQNQTWICLCSCGGPRSLVVLKGYVLTQRKYPECPQCTEDRAKSSKEKPSQTSTLNLIDQYLRGIRQKPRTRRITGY